MSINTFATPPPGNGKWAWLIAGVIAVLVGILVLPMLFQGEPDPLQSASQTSSASPTASSSVILGDESRVPFETSGVSGVWEIINAEWVAGELVLEVEITVETGSLDYEFFAFESEGSVVEPTYGLWDDELRPGYLEAGESVRGRVNFTVSEGKTTVILSDSTRTNGQISALLVEP